MSDVGRPTGGDQPHTLSQAGDGSQLSLKLLASDSQPPGADLQERREQVKDQTEQAARQLDETQKTYDAAKSDATDLIKHLNVSIELIDTACDKLDEQHHDLLGRSKPEVSGRHDAHLMDDLLYAQFMYNHQALLERLQTQEERLAAADIHDIADSVHAARQEQLNKQALAGKHRDIEVDTVQEIKQLVREGEHHEITEFIENQALDRSHLQNSLQFHDYLGEVDEKRAERDAAFTNVRDLLSETIGNIKQLPSSSLEGMETEEIQALSVQVVSLDKLLNMRYGDSTEREPLHAELEALDKKAQDLLQRVDQVSSAMDVSLQPTIDKLDQAATRYAEASAHIREVLEDARALGLRPQPIE